MSASKRTYRPPRPWPTDKHGRPVRRVSVDKAKHSGIYWRRDGRLEIGYTDSAGKLRWAGPFDTLTQAGDKRAEIRGAKAKGERVAPNPRLRFGEAADHWLAERRQAVEAGELRARTLERGTSYVECHLRPRWQHRQLDRIGEDDAILLVRELRAAGLAEWSILGICRAASQVFRFARRRLGWHGDDPIGLLEGRQRPSPAQTPERRIYEGDELAEVLAATSEPWRTLFRLADVVAGRESELLGLWWDDLELSDPERPTIRFGFQVDRQGRRVPLKTEESKATLPLPRSAALMLLEHKGRTPGPTGPRAYVFATRTGKPLGQRNVLRALYWAQEKARKPDGTPTFPELFAHDERGHLVVDGNGAYVLRDLKRRDLNLPHFHSLRHGAAMACEDVEEARDLLRHKTSLVTQTVYRGHFTDRRREQLRARLEARHAQPVATAVPAESSEGGEVLPLRRKAS